MMGRGGGAVGLISGLGFELYWQMDGNELGRGLSSCLFVLFKLLLYFEVMLTFLNF